MNRSKYRQIRPKHEALCKCAHPALVHYSKDGHCAFTGCGCLEFRTANPRPEFTAKRARCNYGHAHNSGLEIRVCADLHYQLLAKEIKEFKAEKVVELPGPSGAIVARYKVDFIVTHNDGSIEFVEAKGDHLRNKQPWPIKWALLQDKHKGDPKYRFREVRG